MTKINSFIKKIYYKQKQKKPKMYHSLVISNG